MLYTVKKNYYLKDKKAQMKEQLTSIINEALSCGFTMGGAG
jgi:molybdopterin biosynthesis enzyme MoaB